MNFGALSAQLFVPAARAAAVATAGGLTAFALAIPAGAAPGDCDADGLPDDTEKAIGTMMCDADTDKDNFRDGDEMHVHFTDPKDTDTDNDNMQDWYEWRNFGTDPRLPDTDGDGLTDSQEVEMKTDPLVKNPPPDGPGTTGGDDGQQNGRPDRDNDGLFDDDETDVYGTDPDIADTDGDGDDDGLEVFNGTDPNG